MNTTTDTTVDLTPSRTIQFWTILAFEIPSLACILYLLSHLLFKKKLRQALNNHVIIILLFLCLLVELIDDPLYLDAYLHRGPSSFVLTPTICLIWWLIDYGVYGAITLFMTWAAFERHILIFYQHRCLNTPWKRMIFHFTPLAIISIYSVGFYLGVLVLPPCENEFDYEVEACGISPCYEQIPWLSIWDYLVNGALFTVIEALLSVALLVRVVYRRYRVQQSMNWRKHRKMTIQLLSISSLSLSITLPQAVLTSIQQVIPGMADFGVEFESYLSYLTTFVVLFLPFICLGCFTELWPRFRRQHRERAVAPVPMTARRWLPLPAPRGGIELSFSCSFSSIAGFAKIIAAAFWIRIRGFCCFDEWSHSIV